MAEAVLVRGLGQRADVYFGKTAHSAGSACWRGGGKRRAAGSTNRGRDAQAPGDAGDEHRGQGSEGARLPDDDVDGRRATEQARRWPRETPWRRWRRTRGGRARLHGGGARDLVGGRASELAPRWPRASSRRRPRVRGSRARVRDSGAPDPAGGRARSVTAAAAGAVLHRRRAQDPQSQMETERSSPNAVLDGFDGVSCVFLLFFSKYSAITAKINK